MTESIYEVLNNGYIKRTDADGKEWFIPTNTDNSDYQAYLNKDKPQVEHLTEKPTITELPTEQTHEGE